MTNRAVFFILGLVIIGIAFGGFFFFQQYQEQQTEIQKLEAIAEKERQKARQAEEARKEQQERKLAEERRKQAERERIRRLERERQIEKERREEAERRRLAEEKTQRGTIVDLASLPDLNWKPNQYLYELPATSGDKITFLDDLIVKADRNDGGSIVLGGKQILLKKGTYTLKVGKGSVYILQGEAFLHVGMIGKIISLKLPKLRINSPSATF